MDDISLLATCIADEAAGEPYLGKLGVARVVRNRMALKYESDGTIAGTVEKHFQFSGFWFSMQAGHYRQVEFDAAGAAQMAQTLHDEFSRQSIWADCLRAANVQSFDDTAWKLTNQTVLYYNPRICAAPAWAAPSKLDDVIFRHNFYHA